MNHRPLATALLLLAGLPTATVAVLALQAGLDAAGWRDLLSQPGLDRSVALTLFTGLASTALAWWISARLLQQAFVTGQLARLLRPVPAMLATPHAAMAIGLVFLLAPSGWLLRLLAPLAGWDQPPAWTTTQDPWGLGLVLALVVKEVPFLLWTAATQLQRDDVLRRWQSEHALALTLGYGSGTAFRRVVWPQLARRLRWPLLAVLAYGLTVVDMALVIGPASPPTLAMQAWQWLLDADALVQSRGAAAGMVLVALVAVCAALADRVLMRRPAPGHGQRGASPRTGPVAALHGVRARAGLVAGVAMVGLYGVVLALLALGSVSGVWPFPDLWPQLWSLDAWRTVADSSATLSTTFWLALASSALALAWSVAWLEAAPPDWDRLARPLLYASLVLPGVLWVVGLYRLGLGLRLEATATGLLLAHTLMVLPYVLLSLSPAYQGFDARHAQVCASLGHGRWAFLWRVKWPLLRRSLAASLAVGFAVSVAQYLPTLYLGAGRLNTVTTEAVTLAAGGQRSLLGAFAGLQWLLPVAAFALAAWVGRPRRFAAPGSA
ncbi:ABC transporter permease [Hydrogenophaga sp. R2]|uniref:ABC transporter permease n=1 Tax=Hydrogenophaga sp. R2 TaxID=3132827 RepID=UPI003CF70329